MGDVVAVEEKPHQRQTATEKRTHEVAHRSFSGAEIERGLLAVAVANGNTRKAVSDLAEDEEGFEVHQATLHRWKQRDLARYEKIRADLLPRIRGEAAEQHMRLAEQQATVAGKMTERLEREIDEIPARDLPGGIRNITTAAAVHTDKAAVLRGEASTITEHRDASEVLRALRARGVVIQGMAEEIPDAELVEGEEA
jgi:hypothetical protein